MKKIFLSILLVLAITTTVVAQTQQVQRNESSSQEEGKSSLSYRNVTIYKILDHKDVYIVLHGKNGLGIGQVMIPKTWSHESPRKLQFRTLPKGLNPFMTVVYKDGEFHKVVLTLPVTKSGNVWGVAHDYADIGDSAQAETLDITY